MNLVLTDVPFGEGTLESHSDTTSGEMEVEMEMVVMDIYYDAVATQRQNKTMIGWLIQRHDMFHSSLRVQKLMVEKHVHVQVGCVVGGREHGRLACQATQLED